MLSTWRCGSMIGLPDMRPSSLRKAMTEPVKVMAPMATPSPISNSEPPVDRCRRRRCRRPAARRAPPPPRTPRQGRRSEWKAATSCGIAVIGTRLAITAPMPPPMARPSDHQRPAGETVRRRSEGERREDGERHADHAVEVALPRRRRMRQAAQRQDEQDAGDEVEKVREVGRHRLSPSSCTSRACAR